MTPPKATVQSTYSNAQNRRRTLSDYRNDVNNSVTVDSNANGKTVSSIRNATKSIASGLSKFKRMVNENTNTSQIKMLISFNVAQINMHEFYISVGHRFEEAFKYGQ